MSAADVFDHVVNEVGTVDPNAPPAPVECVRCDQDDALGVRQPGPGLEQITPFLVRAVQQHQQRCLFRSARGRVGVINALPTCPFDRFALDPVVSAAAR